MERKQFKRKEFMDRLAEDSGLAVVVVDGERSDVSVSNNNSICAALYSSAEFAPKCDQYCGRAFEAASGADRPFDYECHAGLQCRAVPIREGRSRLVAIVGRAFVKAENYRKATQRAIDGDWKKFRPSEFFENVLLTGSSTNIENTAGRLGTFEAPADPEILELEIPNDLVPTSAVSIVETHEVEVHPETQAETTVADEETPTGATAELVYAFYQAAVSAGMGGVAPRQMRGRSSEIAIWRSLFGTLMQKDYQSACSLILQFLSGRYGLASLMWLEKREDEFDVIAAVGPLHDPSIKAAIEGETESIIEAAARDIEFPLNKRAVPGVAARKLHLSPVAIGGEIRGIVAIEGHVDDEVKRNIQRLCRTLGPQLEILRLRSEVRERDWLAGAIRRFNESLQRIDADDFWMHVTQVSAELVQAERASLLVRDEKSDSLQAKASIGSRINLVAKKAVGERVAKLALEDGDPIVVSDINTIKLGASPKDWKYKTPSFISYPIMIGGRKIAVLNFTDKASGGSFGDRDLELLRAISPQIAVAIDRTAMKDRAGEFEQLSVTDPLTGLLNRRYLEKRLAEEIDRSKRHRFPMSLMMIDVDEFKSYNDRFGHTAGDTALKIVAEILSEAVRGEDVAARYGGEEFSILLPQTTATEAAAIAERIRRQIEKTEFPKRRVTVSIGIASSAIDSSSPEDLINAADSALYEAKNQGRNNVQIFEGPADSVNSKIH
jgi:diguanylate cyclase (GGDEF)-like protein